MTHHEQLKQLLMTQLFVPISQMRNWCDYRKRLSELRATGLNIKSITFTDDKGNKIHAYKLVPKDSLF